MSDKPNEYEGLTAGCFSLIGIGALCLAVSVYFGLGAGLVALGVASLLIAVICAVA